MLFRDTECLTYVAHISGVVIVFCLEECIVNVIKFTGSCVDRIGDYQHVYKLVEEA